MSTTSEHSISSSLHWISLLKFVLESIISTETALKIFTSIAAAVAELSSIPEWGQLDSSEWGQRVTLLQP